ncbi:RnfABCDGE type electron transport complex subunit B [Agarivorans sp. MS3-6]|uniref:RnfABCDGE type electron transport complex subunit B n=1 Tax=Agarivorans sp. TSD2052 TaxID=2937286 RepID=UPI002010B54B|nr:RnfABCDGE type electron transport complex subunit B [Agarivorans sp. TSD2052]UPW20363.1 RnfABCDGE type electron transport complex subunit B [Agarivorans sp. TSD2052]
MMIISIFLLVVIGASLGGLLGWASKALKVEGDPRVDELEAMLPGGQCGQCGEPGCRQAAEAMVAGRLSAQSCPPGGAGLAGSIASLLGLELSSEENSTPLVAYIDESNCSGCTRCFKACPFDAIVGATKQMHTVINHICTGCRLCEKACPQGCLSMQTQAVQLNTWQWPKPQVA